MLSIGFIGAGNMAFALAQTFVNNRKEVEFFLYDVAQERIDLFEDTFDLVFAQNSPEEVVSNSQVSFLAVKPQVMPQVLADLKDSKELSVSIAAGVSLATFQKAMPKARVIRVMPNTPCLVGQMAAGFTRGDRATDSDVAFVKDLLACAGEAIEVSENLMDAVTGLSGSGPAYFARIIQYFIAGGQAAGLSAEISRALVLQTIKGTAELLLQKNMEPDELVNMVSSPNGTTVAGREVLESSDINNIVVKTILRTAERSKELRDES